MKIYRKKDKIVCEVSCYQHRNNCYDPEEEKELTDNLIGVIDAEGCSINQLNDLSYKDDQQIGMPLIQTYLEKKDFKKLCEKLKIQCYEFPICERCGKTVYGVYTMDDKYDVLCNECADELEKLDKNKRVIISK